MMKTKRLSPVDRMKGYFLFLQSRFSDGAQKKTEIECDGRKSPEDRNQTPLSAAVASSPAKPASAIMC